MSKNIWEIHRTLDEVELLEQLALDLTITNEAYRSSHEVQGKVRGKYVPDNETKRAREKPPKNALERLASAVKGIDSFALSSGYPQTDLFVALTRVPPTARSDEAHQDNVSEQRFSVEGVPENGTLKLESTWEPREVTEALEEDELVHREETYDIINFPSDQLPVVLRANLHRDAYEYIENSPSLQFRNDGAGARRYEGQAVLSLEVEFPGDAPEAERAGGSGQLVIDNFRVDMESTFNDISILADQKEASNYTYNPEKKRVEWRHRSVRKGGTLHYDIVGPVKQLLGLGHVSASFRGKITNHTLTGTEIQGLYDRTGKPFWHVGGPANTDTAVTHSVQITADIQVDPTALSGDTRRVTTASVTVNDRPSEAFDRVETICRREAMTIRNLQTPANPEPAPNREGVFQITAEEKREADDQPGKLEVKREYGDEGVVYAEIEVTGEFTAMSEESQVSSFDDSKDRLVRSDQGGLETRGKSDIEIKARSASSELNADLISKIKEGLTGVGGERRANRGGDTSLDEGGPVDDSRALESEPTRGDETNGSGGNRQ